MSGKKLTNAEKKAAASSEVKSYTLPPEELEKVRQETGYTKPLTEELYKSYKADGMTDKQIIDNHNLRIVDLQKIKHSWKKQEESPKQEVEKKEELSKERYIELKQSRFTDEEIRKQFSIHSPDLSKMKRKWGVSGMKTDDFTSMKDKEKTDDKKVISLDKYNTVVGLNEELEKENLRLQKLLDKATDDRHENLNKLEDLKLKLENEGNKGTVELKKLQEQMKKKEKLIEAQQVENDLLKVHIDSLQEDVEKLKENPYKVLYDSVAYALKLHLPQFQNEGDK
ncbi:hypothetical protein BTS2_0499 [Bacillus sp. TS-2]|nr:hypothetical protein BTS2_0499 [Bacillus sp. TS-2]